MALEGLNPATALFKVLRDLSQSGEGSIQKGWRKALGAEPGSAEFARRHSEVVGLFRRVYMYLLALDEGNEERERYLKYVPSWYRAIVFPDNWNASNLPAAHTIDASTLDHLAGLGSIIRSAARDALRLDDDAIKALTDSLATWRELLDEADLPIALAEEIRAQVDHIEWLLRNVQTYGTKPVLDETKVLLGTGLTVLKERPSWKKKIAEAMAGLVLVLTGAHESVDQMNGVLEGLVETRHQVERLIEGPKEIEGKTTLELPSGGEVVDAEVVEEPPLSPTPEDQAQG